MNLFAFFEIFGRIRFNCRGFNNRGYRTSGRAEAFYVKSLSDGISVIFINSGMDPPWFRSLLRILLCDNPELIL